MLGDEEDYEINDYDDDNSIEEVENNNLDTSEKNEFITYEEVMEQILKKKKKTVPFLNKFERARLIGVRIQQLSSGAEPKINIEGLNSINEIVEEELKQRKIPLIIKRNLPNGDSEEWKLEEFQKV